MRKELIRNLKCLECDHEIEFNTQPGLIKHIKKEHPEVAYEEYVIKHFFDGIHPECKCGCGTKMKFESFNENFYNDYCKNHWPHGKHTEETKEIIKINLKKAFIEKYGVDNPMKLQKFIDKIAETKEERYGDPHWNNPAKLSETKLNRTPEEVALTNQRLIATNIERYGAKTFTSTEEGKVQVKQTKLKKYGDENYVNIEKIKETKLKNYGYECEFQDREWRSKYNNKKSQIETDTCIILGAEPKFNFMKKEYDMKLGNYIIEVDGDYYHPQSLNSMNITYQITHAVNDYIKTNNLKDSEFELIRINSSKLQKNKSNITLDFILENRYYQDFSIALDQILVTKEEIEYFTGICEIHKIQSKIKSMFRFLRIFWVEYQQFIPENLIPIWLDDNSIKDSISKCFGLNGNSPIDISIKNLIENLEISNH